MSGRTHRELGMLVIRQSDVDGVNFAAGQHSS